RVFGEGDARQEPLVEGLHAEPGLANGGAGGRPKQFAEARHGTPEGQRSWVVRGLRVAPVCPHQGGPKRGVTGIVEKVAGRCLSPPLRFGEGGRGGEVSLTAGGSETSLP